MLGQMGTVRSIFVAGVTGYIHVCIYCYSEWAHRSLFLDRVNGNIRIFLVGGGGARVNDYTQVYMTKGNFILVLIQHQEDLFQFQVKDRKPDQLTNRHRKEQMRQYYRVKYPNCH